MTWNEHLNRAFEEARAIILPVPPPTSFERVRERCSQLPEGNSKLWEPFLTEFYFLCDIKDNVPVSSEECVSQKWANTLAWLIQGLISWRKGSPDSKITLNFMLKLANAMDRDDHFWPQMPEEIKINNELLETLADEISSIESKYEIKASGSSYDIIAQFAAADRANNWYELLPLYNHLNGLQTDGWPGWYAHMLAYFNFDALIDATHNIKQTISARCLIEYLDDDEAFRLALGTESLHLKFAVIYKNIYKKTKEALAQNLPAPKLLTEPLTELLIQISEIPDLWQAWMKVFNSQPNDFPKLQEPLGAALAEMTPEAIGAYIDSFGLHINNSTPHFILYSYNQDRKSVTSCLKSFRQNASLAKRNILWKAAFKRWMEWDFHRASTKYVPCRITFSILDFAIIGYLLESCNDQECKEHLVEYYDKLNRLSDNWYFYHEEYQREKWRLLSHMQPFLHAYNIRGTDQDWLMEEPYPAYDPETDPYYALKFNDTGSF